LREETDVLLVVVMGEGVEIEDLCEVFDREFVGIEGLF